MKTYLNFGGFYYSDHGSAVEMWVTGPYDCECDDEYDWRQAYDLYANFMSSGLTLYLIQIWCFSECGLHVNTIFRRTVLKLK